MRFLQRIALAVVLALVASSALAAEKVTPTATATASMVMAQPVAEHFAAPRTTYAWKLIRAGEVVDSWTSTNLVLTGGKNDLLDKYFKGSGYTATWYLALKGSGTIAAGDVWTSHAGWSEVTPYAGNRPTITWGTTSAGSNTATQVAISINATATVAGACLSSVNTGTSGILYACTDFAAARSVVSGDTLQVTPTVTD